MIRLAGFFGSMLVLSLMCSYVFLSMPKAYSTLQFENGKIKIDVYVIALDGVEVRDVDNVTKVLDGAREAVETVNENNFTVVLPFARIWVNVSSHFFRRGAFLFDTWFVDFHLPVNASFHVITEWDVYKSVVESSRECVVVNAHGAVVPIPEGYAKEAWIDKIAEAMLYRNVTWVHVGGYPFSYFQKQGSPMEIWGSDGLKKLMANIGKPNVTCTKSEYEKSIVNNFFKIVDDTWFITMAYKVPRTWPLNGSDFGWLAFPIWGYYHPNYKGGYYPLAGVAIAFKKSLNETSFGYYVHIGTNSTTSEGGVETDKDFWRAHHGCATGLYCLLARTSGEIMLFEAQQSIEKALSEGRTHGLNEALYYFNEAKYFHQLGENYEFWDRIYLCMTAAVNAEKPPSNSDVGVAILIVLAVGVVVSTGVYWKKRNSENNEEEKQSDD